ncbi:hypothetical protein OFO07_01815 [Campylobacter sp. JMF_06 NA1]|uniref:hypothetical protein n=1 Tax=Campylobacter sp. JMF_06 NA1 TaxID=2983823 RepID=UPI0022E9EF61|nr:hypothetical protein [Campylobacter sp. JMF_06 NA1]MDA3077659.1 hypothetical protein [Campylobacter sp. JMF_06 NA1]
MRKILILFGICGALNAGSFDELKISVVKNFYQNQGGFKEICDKYCTNSFKISLLQDEEFAGDGELGCLDFDPRQAGQDDLCNDMKSEFEISEFGDVKASLKCKGYKDTNIVYKTSCNESECKVDDIYNIDEGTAFSVKEMIYDCLKTHQKEKK